MIVDIHIPLVMDHYSPRTAWNMIYILEKLNVAANYPIEQTSCGFEQFQNGFLDDAKKTGEKFIREFNNDRPVIIPSAQQAAFIKKDYSKLFQNTAFHNEYKQLQKSVFEFTDYIVNQEDIQQLSMEKRASVGLHLGCAERKYGIAHNLEKILSSIEGTNIIHLNKAENCCGNGAGFSYRDKETSSAMGTAVLEGEVEVDYIVSTELDCLLHLKASNPEISSRFVHIIDYLAMAIKKDF